MHGAFAPVFTEAWGSLGERRFLFLALLGFVCAFGFIRLSTPARSSDPARQATADGSKRSGLPGGSPKSNAAISPRSERRRSRRSAVADSSTAPSASTTTP